MQKSFQINIVFNNQIRVYAIEFRKYFTKFMIYKALL